MRVRARVYVPAGAVDTPGAVVRVRVLDVSRADASSQTLAEVLRPVDAIGGPDGGTTVDLDVPSLARGADYGVAAHVDLDGSGDVSLGDLVTVQHVGVDASTDEQDLDVPVQRVTA